jgi:transcriptional regulator with XRE-family HTH domain
MNVALAPQVCILIGRHFVWFLAGEMRKAMVRLKELREARFLTQRELAEKAGVALATITRVELGQVVPNFSTIRKLAAALGVEPQELVPDAGAFSEARKRKKKGQE